VNAAARAGRRRSATRLRPGWAATGAAWRLGLLAVGLGGAAINTGNNLLYLICGIVLASLPVSLVASWWNTSAVEIDVSTPRHPRVGVDLAVEIRLDNRRRRGHARGCEIQLFTDDGGSARAWVERLDAGQRLRLVVPLLMERRGPGSIAAIGLVTTFPLGLLRRVRVFPRHDAFLVLPAAVRPEQDGGQRPIPGQGETSPWIAGDEFEGLRRGGDNEDSRRVDWKSTARRGVTVVRTTAGEATRGVTLDLDTRVAGEPEPAHHLFEQRVSRRAGAGEVSLVAGGTVHLTVNGSGGKCYAGRSGLIPFLARLARVESRDGAGRIRVRPAVERSRVASRPSLPEMIASRRSPPGRAHRLSALVALVVSFTAVAAYGGVPAPLWFAFVAAVGTTILFPRRLIARRDGWMRRGWNVAAVACLLAFGVELAGRGNLLTASSHLIVFITFFQLFNAVTPRDDRLILLLSLLHLVLASALTTEMSFGLVLTGGMLALVHGQIAIAAMRPEVGIFRPTVFGSPVAGPRYGTSAGAITACLVVFGTLLFFLIPHLGTGTYDLGRRAAGSVAGFSDQASLGDIGRIKLDNTPVMEVELADVPVGIDLKWRGAALERFDGRTWRRTDEDAEFVSADATGRFELERRSTAGRGEGGMLVQHVRLTPDATNTLFAAERAVQVVSDDFPLIRRDGTGALQAPARGGRRIVYRVTSRVAPREPDRLRAATGADPSGVLHHNLALPQLDPRIPELARTIVADAPTRYDAALAIERWVSERHQYALDVRDRGRGDPLAAFLFDGMAGHCEYFATAMVVLARSSGIPSRLVTGYLRGEKSRFSRRFIVRQSDAHAWVEIFLPGAGWIAFDPTPPAGRSSRDRFALADLLFDLQGTARRWWDDHLIGSDLQDQIASLLAARDLLLDAASRAEWILVLAPPLAGGWWFLRRRRVRRVSSAPVFYRRLQSYLARNGVTQRPDETAEEVARRAADRLPVQVADRVRRLTELYYRVRFDPETSESDVQRSAAALLSELQRAGTRRAA